MCSHVTAASARMPRTTVGDPFPPPPPSPSPPPLCVPDGACRRTVESSCRRAPQLAFKLYGRSCSAMDAMFDSLHVLLTPSLIGLGILAWAFYVINGLICAAGCHRNSVPLLTGGAYGRLRFSSTKFGLARVTPGRLLRKKESGGMEMVMDPV